MGGSFNGVTYTYKSRDGCFYHFSTDGASKKRLCPKSCGIAAKSSGAEKSRQKPQTLYSTLS